MAIALDSTTEALDVSAFPVPIDGLCKARCMPFSAHCAPAISAHVCEGTLDPAEGLLTPDRRRPGLGLELRRDEAERYEVS